jgi:DNA recombination protein RmuC
MERQLVDFILPGVALLVGLAVGIGLTWLALRGRVSSANEEVERERTRLAECKATATDCQNQLNAARAECARLAERANRVPVLEGQLTSLQERLQGEIVQVAELTTSLAAERQQAAERVAFLDGAKGQLSAAFKSLAGEILEEKATRFTEQNKTNIGHILEPLRTKLAEFQSKVDQVYVQEGKDRAALGEQVRQLTMLNRQLSDDARNLAHALKGSGKMQGNWGEMILERVLEISGLCKGRDYELREFYERGDGHRGQPDVVINLPGGRHLVIDSKTSLTDYEQFVNAVDDTDRNAAIGRHVGSMRKHVKELSEQDYQKLCGLSSLDFVVMFVPIESAFAVAIAQDTGLCEDACDRNVLLVSPSTLLFVLRTVAYLWRQEDQARNVRDIANRGAELYNKLVGFVEDLDKLDNRLRQARESFDSAYKKLSKGQGNVIRQATMLKEMGVQPSKLLPDGLVESALEDSPVLPSLAAVAETELHTE